MLAASAACHTWRGADTAWSPAFSLRSARAWAASVLVPDPRTGRAQLLVIGGVDADNRTLATVERVLVGSRRAETSAVRLPLPLAGHCAVQLNSTHTFITGGCLLV